MKIEHYNILVDDVPLDMQLHQLYPDLLFLGLIPVMTEGLNTDEEKSVARTRYLSSKGVENLGENVEWLELVPVMRFRREDYVKALNLIYTLEDESM